MKNKSLINFIDFLTFKGFNVTKKIGKVTNNKNTEDNTKIFLKIIITLLFIALLNIPFEFLRIVGKYIIYDVGIVFRELLSNCWVAITNFTYVISSLLLLHNVFSSILNDKELNIIELDRKKDKKVKKNIFEPLLKIVEILLIIVCIPLILFVIFLFICLGIYILFFIKGYGLIGIPFIIIGFIIIFITLFSIIKEFTKRKGGKK